MPGIGIISNPYAKINKRDPEHNTIMWYILGTRGQFEVTRTLPELERICSEFKDRGLDHVGIVGGDGSIGLTLSAIHQAWGDAPLPRILLLRGGTINVLAQNLGLKGSPRRLMSRFLEHFHGETPFAETTFTSLKVNGRLGFLFANGMASSFLAGYYENKSNAVGAALFLTRLMGDALTQGRLGGASRKIVRRERMRVALNDGDFSEAHPTSILFASSIPCIPFGVKLFRQLEVGTEYFEYVRVLTEGNVLIKDTLLALAGGTLTPEQAQQGLVRKMVIENLDSKSFSLDGDLLESEDGRIVIEPGPRFTFLRFPSPHEEKKWLLGHKG